MPEIDFDKGDFYGSPSFNTIQPVQDDFSTDGQQDEFARIDHQHALAPGLKARLGMGTFGGKYPNLIQNAQMSIAQRSPTPGFLTGIDVNSISFFADRWLISNNGVGTQVGDWDKYSVLHSGVTWPLDTPKPTFGNPTITTVAGAPGVGGYIIYRQAIEGLNLQHLAFGTPDAKALSLSFDCFSKVAGTYVVELITPGGGTRTVSWAFTIAANTITHFSHTFPGDTSGLINPDTNVGMYLQFFVAAGTQFTTGVLNTTWNNNVDANRAVGITNGHPGTIGNSWEVWNVQLEASPIPTDFVVIPYDQELRTCMRYFERFHSLDAAFTVFGAGQCIGGGTARFYLQYRVTKRAKPSVVYNGAFGMLNNTAAAVIVCTSISTRDTSIHGADINTTVAAGLALGDATFCYSNNVTTSSIDVGADI